MKALPIAIAITLGTGQAAQAKDLAFISCPIVRDTSSVPCWLSDYQGQLQDQQRMDADARSVMTSHGDSRTQVGQK